MLTNLDKHVDIAKLTLEAMHSQGEGFAPLIVPMRGGDPVASIIPPDDHSLMRFVRVAAGGFHADTMVVICDTWHSTNGGIDPRTGKVWEPDAMEEAVRMDDALAKGWVSESLTLTWFQRNGETGTTVLPYTRTDSVLVWGDRQDDIVEVVPKAAEAVWSAPAAPRGDDDKLADEMVALLLTFKGCQVELG